jgi:antibiotic biosynthesis monooxygenase (ABM) superfamily enzyme
MTERVHVGSSRLSSSRLSSSRFPWAPVLVFVTLLFSSQLALAQQALPKLLPGGTVGAANAGYAVALSATGDTAIVGGWGDNSYVGAAWVFTRNRGVWTQQGPKLVSTSAVGPAYQGYSVGLSADGNTAIVGGANDDNGVGAVWVFTRSGDSWTQKGGKLVAADAAGHAHQGYSVSLSNDGNTAIVGGAFDAGNIGAAWIWTRSGDTWTQQGGKLVGAGVVGPAEQGSSVAMSRDGNTALVGGPNDNSGAGAAWVFTRSGDAWIQQGSKLVGNDFDGPAGQGGSVALSRDGNTAIVGGHRDRDFVGAAWFYTRSDGIWTQQGSKLVGPAVGRAYQGWSVSMSGDGNTAIVGGPTDDNIRGAAWIYIRRSGSWYLLGNKLVGAGAVGPAGQGSAVALSAGGDTAIVGGRLDDGGLGAAWVFAATASAPGGR